MFSVIYYVGLRDPSSGDWGTSGLGKVLANEGCSFLRFQGFAHGKEVAEALFMTNNQRSTVDEGVPVGLRITEQEEGVEDCAVGDRMNRASRKLRTIKMRQRGAIVLLTWRMSRWQLQFPLELLLG